MFSRHQRAISAMKTVFVDWPLLNVFVLSLQSELLIISDHCYDAVKRNCCAAIFIKNLYFRRLVLLPNLAASLCETKVLTFVRAVLASSVVDPHSRFPATMV